MITDKGYVHIDGFGRKGIAYTNDQTLFQFYEQNMDMGLMKACKEIIEQDQHPPVSARAGRFTVQLVEMAHQSIKTKKVIHM